MTGSIHKKGKTYYIVFRLCDSGTGKRNQKWIPAGKSKKAADTKLNELMGDVHNGTYREIRKIIFADFARLWLSSYDRTSSMCNCSWDTHRSRRHLIDTVTSSERSIQSK